MDKGVSNWDLDNRLNSLEREVRRLRRLASEDGSTGGEELLLPTPIIKNILNPGKGIIYYESTATDDDEMFFNKDGSKNRTFIKDIDMSKIKFSVTYPSGFPSFNNLVNSGEVRIQLLRYKKGKFRFIGSADIPNDKYFGDPKIISRTSYKYISPNTNPENNIEIEIPTNWFVDTESLPIIQYYGEKLEIAHWKRGSKLAVMFMYKMPSGEWLKSPLSKTIKIYIHQYRTESFIAHLIPKAVLI